MARDAKEFGWHLQVCEREWVFWGYGKRPKQLKDEPLHVGSHVEPACMFVRVPMEDPALDPLAIDIPFELPKGRFGGKPTEYGRATCWGWRVRTNDGLHDCGWHMADSKEMCVRDANAWLTRQSMRPNDEGEKLLRRATEDVREYGTGLV
jgi:hypothetical protein